MTTWPPMIKNKWDLTSDTLAAASGGMGGYKVPSHRRPRQTQQALERIHHPDDEVLHFLIVDLVRCVHVFQFRAVPRTVPGYASFYFARPPLLEPDVDVSRGFCCRCVVCMSWSSRTPSTEFPEGVIGLAPHHRQTADRAGFWPRRPLIEIHYPTCHAAEQSI
jgi:hypothetical protein